MEELRTKGSYGITEEMKAKLSDFAAGYASAQEMKQAIRDTFENTGYVMDTHTAVAAAVYDAYKKIAAIRRRRSSHQRRVRTSSQKACWMRFIRVHMSNRRRSVLPMN